MDSVGLDDGKGLTFSWLSLSANRILIKRAVGFEVATLANAPMLARLPISPTLMAIADGGKLDEYDAPLRDELARELTAATAAKPKPKETISII
jgi:hypothetical protein